MADKKKSPRNDFSNNPFKTLKGLSVSEQHSGTKPDKSQVSPTQPAEKLPQQPTDDPALFDKEMGWLGVRRLAQDEPSDDSSPVKTPVAQVSADEEDAESFALAMSGMETTFEDDWPESPVVTASPRRRRQFKRGQVKPEAELDLHGLTREEALTKVGYFLENARHHGFRVVLVITGKGDRSGGEGILRSAVSAFLSNQSGLVLEWFEAPRQYGGSGALVVYLRRDRDD